MSLILASPSWSIWTDIIVKYTACYDFIEDKKIDYLNMFLL